MSPSPSVSTSGNFSSSDPSAIFCPADGSRSTLTNPRTSAGRTSSGCVPPPDRYEAVA